MYRDVLKIFLLYRLTRSVLNIDCSYVIEYLWCTWVLYREKFKFVSSFSCPSSVLVNMIYCSVKYCCSNSSISGVILQSIMKSIKTPNHPAYHWSTLWPLELWVGGLYNPWWFCVHKLSMFIYLSMVFIKQVFIKQVFIKQVFNKQVFIKQVFIELVFIKLVFIKLVFIKLVFIVQVFIKLVFLKQVFIKQLFF